MSEKWRVAIPGPAGPRSVDHSVVKAPARCLTYRRTVIGESGAGGLAGWGARRHRGHELRGHSQGLGSWGATRRTWTLDVVAAWRGPIWASRRMWHLVSGVRIGDAVPCVHVRVHAHVHVYMYFQLGATGEDSGETGVGLGRVCTRTSDILRHRPHGRWNCQCGIGTRWSNLALFSL